ncbi:hypothetical protein CEV32_2359 [Brucella rhizosphaerae]|uniref:Uncharacterized protein n=1 Tax=Brucella rhizosphaerae TaxID=571254 RepID=A0A256F4Z8_9HYPH|nr:hypothetical protein CEV32_2359 [Brucella rhizosphaerae]
MLEFDKDPIPGAPVETVMEHRASSHSQKGKTAFGLGVS